jgi:hypothetical protein
VGEGAGDPAPGPRPVRAQYGDLGGEMLPIKLLEDLTGTPLRFARDRVSPAVGAQDQE